MKPLGLSRGSVLLLIFFSILFSGAHAGSPVLHLDARAVRAVANDEMWVVLAIEKEGSNVGAMNQEVNAALNQALSQAKKVEGVNARLGSFNTSPLWNAQGKNTGWRVRGEIQLDSKNMAALSSLAGDLSNRMQLASVSFKPSRGLVEKTEKELLREAIAQFRSKAAEAASAFGYKGYEPKEIRLGGQGGIAPVMVRQKMVRGMMAEAAMAAPVPAEAGDSEISLQVDGSVELR